jgi:hypothetical protein
MLFGLLCFALVLLQLLLQLQTQRCRRRQIIVETLPDLLSEKQQGAVGCLGP